MANTKHKPAITKVGEEVLDFVIPYIPNVDDRNSLSLVSCKFYQIDGITRKRLTVHVLYYPNPASLSKRFPFIESLTLKGPPHFTYAYHNDIRITPWIEPLALEFRCLKELHIRGLVVLDEDLETLARTRGKDLRSLKINKCEGFSTHGLRHVSKYCKQLRTFSLENCGHIEMEDDVWIHQLSMNSTVLERLDVRDIDISNNAQELTLLAKNCSNSLISLKIGRCNLSKLGDAFRYAVRLEHFTGDIRDVKKELVGFQFPPNMRSLSLEYLPVTRYSVTLPFLNYIRKLHLSYFEFNECQCLLIKRCPNLEVLYTEDVCGDKGLLVIGQFCKKLRKLTHNRLVTHLGLIALAKGCTQLECLKVKVGNISNEALECVGTHLKNLRKFHIWLVKKYGMEILPLHNGIQVMLMGCSKLQTLNIIVLHGRLTDVCLEYIGKYGSNLRSLSLTLKGNSGLVKLSEGCLNLRKLHLMSCPFSKQAVTTFMFNMRSLKYVYVCPESYDRSDLALIRPEFRL